MLAHLHGINKTNQGGLMPFYLDRMPALLDKADQILNHFLNLPREITGEKTGGYLTMRDSGNGQIILCVPLGHIPSDKVHKYAMLSQEKAWRLWEKHSQRGDKLSWQSRDPELCAYGFQSIGKDNWGLWGGAIHAGPFILSFSGLPEMGDEALVLVLAVLADFITLKKAWEMATISNNRVFDPLFNLATT